ncbi:Hypothetical predicted protein [Cloeon dipterum]|uniref:Uncharacterized protein n=1 Tax=Cloeon dipterum TaxID=197152 RepID=A0A8S1D8Z8_9INSE|nr:Hypothetical predicted protein [Cloeon dipterum]
MKHLYETKHQQHEQQTLNNKTTSCISSNNQELGAGETKLISTVRAMLLPPAGRMNKNYYSRSIPDDAPHRLISFAPLCVQLEPAVP